MGKDLRVLLKYISGFTLIELLVVVIIIGILASLAVPMYTKTIERAREGEARTNLLLIYSAEKMYKFDYDVFTSVLDDDNAETPDLSNYVDNPNDTAKYYDFEVVDASVEDFLSRASREVDSADSRYKQLHIRSDGNIQDGPGAW